MAYNLHVCPVLQDREPGEFTALEENLGFRFVREVFLHGVRARFRITYGQA